MIWMKNRARVVSLTAASLCPLLWAAYAAAAVVDVPVTFDMGAETSPVVEGARQVTGKTVYSEKTGFGWTTPEQTSFDRDKPMEEFRHAGSPLRPDLFYERHANDVTRDGVASEKDLSFRIDVTPGTYRVNIWVGDLHEPLESLAVECNGVTVASDISAKHILGRNEPESTGLYRVIRFDVDASQGRIELGFSGDEANYRNRQAQYDEWFGDGKRVDSFRRTEWDPDRHLKFDPTGPFTRNSVLAVRVMRLSHPLMTWSGGKLIGGNADSEQAAFIRAVNAGDFKKAESLLEAPGASPDLRLRGYLALIGHPAIRTRDEERLLPKADKAVADALKNTPGDALALEARDSLDLFSKTRTQFMNRGFADEGHFPENRKVVSMMRMFRPGDLLYYKALQYQGRALQMLDPHRWVYVSGDARNVWKELSEAFPDDRFAQFYLTNEWSLDEDWHHGDYLKDAADAPDWAVATREAFNLHLDFNEWWAANKQWPDGSIGGGWGDDVELVTHFGVIGFVSEGASEATLAMCRKLVDGVWNYGGIDQQAGFYRGFSDTEHSAEWTGDTLPLMLTIDYGNPLWVERAAKTAQLMRSLWMAPNDRGDYHFRANYIGSTRVGTGLQCNDSFINIRATFPAMAAYLYNKNPEIGRLFTQWADAWYNDAMRTDGGKPRGIIPSDVGFPKGEFGGVGSPNWYTAIEKPGLCNHPWDILNYKFYLVDLMFLAHQINGDAKYFEPFRLQKQLMEAYQASADSNPAEGTAAWAGKVLAEHRQPDGTGLNDIWRRVEKTLSAQNSDLPPERFNKQEVLDEMNFVRNRMKLWWPILTTETSATDRVAFPRLDAPFQIMTGAGVLDPSVNYWGVGRDFAAFVKHTDERHLKIVMYNFASAEGPAGIIPWKLALGGKYRLKVGIDRDGDDNIDEPTLDDSFVLERRQQRVELPFPPHETTIVEIDQIEPGRQRDELLPDLAILDSEIRYSIWTRDLQVTIHNVGSQAAEKFQVAFYEGAGPNARKIGEEMVPYLSWPSDLEAKSVTVSIPYRPTRESLPITVVIDEESRIDEICETNNRATRNFELNLTEVNAPRNRVGEIGGDVTSEINRGLR